MINAQNLRFSYGKAEVIKNVSLNLEKGKLYAVIGPNGSGKTTLIKLLSRLNKESEGSLFLDGEPYGKIGRKDFARKVALLPQGRNVPTMTVFDLVSCGRFPHLDLSRRMTAQDEEIVRFSMKSAGVEAFGDKPLKKLSGGQRQRVYIAMLLAQDAPYVLLDEPTTHLDISAKFDIMELLCDIRRSGKCVVAVLHDLDLALKYADEIILMSRGEIVNIGSPEETVASGKIQSAFGVKCESIDIEGQKVFHFDASNNLTE